MYIGCILDWCFRWKLWSFIDSALSERKIAEQELLLPYRNYLASTTLNLYLHIAIFRDAIAAFVSNHLWLSSKRLPNKVPHMIPMLSEKTAETSITFL